MRKILSQAEIEKKQKRNMYLLGFLMIFLMVFATAAYSFMDKSDQDEEFKTVENGVTFYRVGDYWTAQIGEEVFEFVYLPSEVSEVEVEGNFSFSDYLGQTIYFNSLPEGSTEILRNLQDYYQRYQEACLFNQTCDRDLPQKTCFDNFFVFSEGENKVYKTNNCVYIKGDGTKGADAFLYKLLGID